MSRRKIRNEKTLELRKMNRYLNRKGYMDNKDWQKQCMKEARKNRLLKKAKEPEPEFIPEERKWNEEKRHYEEI